MSNDRALIPIIVAERDAILTALGRVFEAHKLPKDEQIEHAISICLSLSGELWSRRHDDLSAEDLANVFSDMARESVLAYHIACRQIYINRCTVKGVSNA